MTSPVVVVGFLAAIFLTLLLLPAFGESLGALGGLGLAVAIGGFLSRRSWAGRINQDRLSNTDERT